LQAFSPEEEAKRWQEGTRLWRAGSRNFVVNYGTSGGFFKVKKHV